MATAPFWTSRTTLYYRVGDLEGHRLAYLIAEKGCDCSVTRLQKNAEPPPAFAVVNPDEHYPFLTDRMLALWNADVIEAYLAERFPEPAFLPTDFKVRAQIRQISAVIRQWYLLDPRRTTWLENAMRQLAALLGTHAWIAGANFTLADIAAAPLLWREFQRGASMPRALVTYGQRLFQHRPHFAQTVADTSDIRLFKFNEETT